MPSPFIQVKDRACPNCGGPMGIMGEAPTTTDWQCLICHVWGRWDKKKGKWLQLRKKLK